MNFALLLVGIFVGVLIIAGVLTVLAIVSKKIQFFTGDEWRRLIRDFIYFAGFLIVLGILGEFKGPVSKFLEESDKLLIYANFAPEPEFIVMAGRGSNDAAQNGNKEVQNFGLPDFCESVGKASGNPVDSWSKAAEQWSAEAQFNLKSESYYCEGVGKDPRRAVKLWNKAAERGLAEAQSNLGVAYYFGKGVGKDPHIAVDWWGKAAERGLAEAQFNLGLAYYLGEGVDKDPGKVVDLWGKAVDQGLAEAQFNLGVAYYFGDGVAKDLRKAFRLLRELANQGNEIAQHFMGVMYWNGEGVVTDKRESYIWFSIARASGNEEVAKKFREREWRNFLSEYEIESAKKEAAQRFGEIEERREK